MSGFLALNHNPINSKSSQETENDYFPNTPKKVPKVELFSPKHNHSFPDIKSPSQVSSKFQANSPNRKVSRMVSSVVSEEDKNARRFTQMLKTDEDQVRESNAKRGSNFAEKSRLQKEQKEQKEKMHASHQLLIYIPENFRSLQTNSKDAHFSSFTELSQNTKNSHEKLLENLNGYNITNRYSYSEFEGVNSSIENVQKVLKLNKLQKRYYAKEIEKEKKEVVLPLIKMVKEDQVKSKKMPLIKVLPSRKGYYGNNFIEMLMNSNNNLEIIKNPAFNPAKKVTDSADSQKKEKNKRESKSSKAIEEKVEEETITLFNYKFFWNYSVPTSKTMWKPCVREGHSFTAVGKWVILYGGLSNGVMDDLVLYDPAKNTWKTAEFTGEIPRSGRHGHTAVEFKKNLFIFGGEQAFNPTLNFRECLNDVYMYNPEKAEWKYCKSLSNPLNPRRYHAACVHNRNMFVYGGISNEGKFMRDLWTFDLKICTWTQVEVEGDRESGLAFHSMVTCYVDKTNPLHNQDKTKLLEEGVYVFGGKNAEGKIVNTLKYVPLNQKTFQWKYPVVKGTPPTPRYNHSMMFYEPLGIIIVYGGKNDELFGTINDVCLSDIRILNVEQMAWSPSSSYGDVPQIGRYHHRVTLFNNKMLIFGGIELQKFTDEEVRSVELNQAETNRLIKTHIDFTPDESKPKNKNRRSSFSKEKQKAQERSSFHFTAEKEVDTSITKPPQQGFVSWQPLPYSQYQAEEQNEQKKKKGKRDRSKKHLSRIISSENALPSIKSPKAW